MKSERCQRKAAFFLLPGGQYIGVCRVIVDMKVLLLGATGLLGHNVMRRLLADGHEVVALVRRAGAVRVEGTWREVVGSLLSDADLLRAAEGCNAVVNCAGVTDMSFRRLTDYTPVNTDLCRRLVAVCERCGIGTIVHTSTVNTIGNGTRERPSVGDEPMQEPFASSLYAASKRAGEEQMLEAARRHADWHVVVVNPGFMLGACDVRPSSGRMLLAAYRRRLMAAPKGGKAFVAVQDVAQACVNALTRGRSGSRYVAVGCEACMSIADLYRLQAEAMGYSQKVVPLPRWLVLTAGAVGNAMRSLGVRTELSLNNVRQLMVQEHYDGSRAVEELGINQTPIREAIKEFHQWRETNLSKR